MCQKHLLFQMLNADLCLTGNVLKNLKINTSQGGRGPVSRMSDSYSRGSRFISQLGSVYSDWVFSPRSPSLQVSGVS
jgi:hypothetical protein